MDLHLVNGFLTKQIASSVVIKFYVILLQSKVELQMVVEKAIIEQIYGRNKDESEGREKVNGHTF